MVAPRLARVLFAEDFDDEGPDAEAPAEPEIIRAEPRSAEPLPLTFSLEELQTAREEARRLGREEGAAAASAAAGQAAQAALSRIAAELAAGRTAAGRVAEEAAEELARLACRMIAAALPAFSARHGEAEIRAAARALLPGLATEPRVVVRVNPVHLPGLQAEIAQLELDAARVEFVPLPEVPPGDLRVAWEAGRASREAAAIREAVERALGLFGLDAAEIRGPSGPEDDDHGR